MAAHRLIRPRGGAHEAACIGAGDWGPALRGPVMVAGLSGGPVVDSLFFLTAWRLGAALALLWWLVGHCPEARARCDPAAYLRHVAAQRVFSSEMASCCGCLVFVPGCNCGLCCILIASSCSFAGLARRPLALTWLQFVWALFFLFFLFFWIFLCCMSVSVLC